MADNNLLYGELVERDVDHREMFDLFKRLFSKTVRKTTTYKFAFLQSILDCCKESGALRIPYTRLFRQFAQLYWTLLIAHDVPQIQRNSQREKSLAEAVIQKEIASGGFSKEVPFDQLPGEVIGRITSDMVRYASKIVVSALYEDTKGVFFGFSKAEQAIVLSHQSHTFLSHYHLPLSQVNRVFWIDLMEKYNGGVLPNALSNERGHCLNRLYLGSFREVVETYLSDILPPLTSPDPTADVHLGQEKGLLSGIKGFIDESIQILKRRADDYTVCSNAIRSELESVAAQSPFDNLLVQTRVKSELSLPEKIYRRNHHSKYKSAAAFMQYLPDVIGARFVCLLDTEETALYQYLRTVYCDTRPLENGMHYHCKPGPVEADKLYLLLDNQPETQKNGHSIYRISCKWYSVALEEFINVELQIKSMIHYFWGELDHMLFYKNYSYHISSPFYSKYMNAINTELHNIDSQLSMLRNEIDKSGYESIREIKRIASQQLYKKYHPDVQDKVACTIDLREVFDLLTDMFFQDTSDESAMQKHLSALFSNLSTHGFRGEVIDSIQDAEQPSQSKFSSTEWPFAKTIHQILQERDIFWIFFTAIYASQFLQDNELEYEIIVRRICTCFVDMTNVFESTLRLRCAHNEGAYEAYVKAVYYGIADAFDRYRKLDFFLYDLHLHKINQRVNQVVGCLHVTPAPFSRDHEHKLAAISHYIACAVLVEASGKVEMDMMSSLANAIRQAPLAGLPFDHGVFEGEKGKDYLTRQQFAAICPLA